MIEFAKAHSKAAAIELPAFELPDVQNIRKWNGWPGGQPVMPFVRASSPNIIEVDSGQSGLTPPAGYTWLEPE